MSTHRARKLELSTPLTERRRTRRAGSPWGDTIRLLLSSASGGAVLWLYSNHDTFWSGVAAVALTIVACRAMKGGIGETPTQ